MDARISFRTAAGRKIVIRDAVPQDIGARGQGGIRDLFNAVRRHERAEGRSPLAPPQYGNWVRAMKRAAAGEDRFQVLVAEDKGRIVGFGLATHLLNEPSTTLNKLFIAADLQGTGLGRKLIQLIKKQSQYLGKSEINTSAESGKGKASGFYQHVGFKVYGTEKTKGGTKKDHLRLAIR